MRSDRNRRLGDVEFSNHGFSALDGIFEEFTSKDFRELVDRKRSERVNRSLLQFIEEAPEPCFLLSIVLEFVDRVNREEVLHHYTFNSFELWLNQYSGLHFEENYRIRAKIAGKLVDRSDYQAFFPIGGGKIYEGTHFVTAHKSPDLDTTVASFWGWLDAFAARVGDGLHIWNVPGGPPAQVEIDWIFKHLFGSSVFTRLAKTRTSLSLVGNDLMTQKGMIRKHLEDSLTGIDHDRGQNAVVVVDKKGFYLGDWRSADVEGVREVILLLSSCLRWFENTLHLRLIDLFGKKHVRAEDVIDSVQPLYQLRLEECEPGREFTSKQKQTVQGFLVEVLQIRDGLHSDFASLGRHLRAWVGEEKPLSFESAELLLAAMRSLDLFDREGRLIEDRSRIFGYFEQTVRALHETIFAIRQQLETLEIALKTKTEVFKHHPTFVTVRSDVEEIRSKMGSHPYLLVAYPDRDRLYPVGVIHASALRKATLGTVSLRDFCNREEMGIPAYLETISVIDHHKSSLNTSAPPFAIIADAQSSNTLVAQQSFLINDRHSLLGQTLEGIEKQIAAIDAELSPSDTRRLQNLLQRRMIAKQKTKFFVHPEREYIEYLHFLYAIIDDTDLLTKVTPVDVECVAQLLNRMKSLVSGTIAEIISLDDLPRSRGFAKKAAQRILQNEDMYSIYRKVYALREQEIEQNLRLASEGKASNLFADTKEQNGCCRVGQTKLFGSNIKAFEQVKHAIYDTWVQMAAAVSRETPEIALHLHMTSTIVSAEEVYSGKHEPHHHRDELWIWIPAEETAVELLKRFLGAFQGSPGLKNSAIDVEFLGERAEEFSLIFKESFMAASYTTRKGPVSMAVIRFNPGALNSRKAMVTPFLPS